MGFVVKYMCAVGLVVSSSALGMDEQPVTGYTMSIENQLAANRILFDAKYQVYALAAFMAKPENDDTLLHSYDQVTQVLHKDNIIFDNTSTSLPHGDMRAIFRIDRIRDAQNNLQFKLCITAGPQDAVSEKIYNDVIQDLKNKGSIVEDKEKFLKNFVHLPPENRLTGASSRQYLLDNCDKTQPRTHTDTAIKIRCKNDQLSAQHLCPRAEFTLQFYLIGAGVLGGLVAGALATWLIMTKMKKGDEQSHEVGSEE